MSTASQTPLMTDRVMDGCYVTVLMGAVRLPLSLTVLVTYAALVYLACWSIVIRWKPVL